MESKDEKFQPAKLSDREREGQKNAAWNVNGEAGEGNPQYGMANKFNRASKVTKTGGDYQNFSHDEERGNFSQKNSSISRLDMIDKNNPDQGTAYNGKPIPETYKPATSHGTPDADAVQYKTIIKDRNA